MLQFAHLKQCNHNLYRGSSGAIMRTIMSVAVGPRRKVAQAILNNHRNIQSSMHDEVVEAFRKVFLSGKVHIPQVDFVGKLDFILKSPEIAGNHLTIYEHVVGEESVLSINTSLLLESITSNPRIACLYAYGINIDEYLDHGTIVFVRGQSNTNAFIAVLHRQGPVPLAQIVEMSLVGKYFGVEECERRINRDSESVLKNAEAPATIISLPVFDSNNPSGSLNNAAECLRNAGVAI